jgi:hypothetical protein
LEVLKQSILFLSDASLFLEFARECFKQEGCDFFDFGKWEECKLQISDLSPTFIIIDFDHYDQSDLGEVQSSNLPIIGVFSEGVDINLNELNLVGKIQKPIAVLDFVPSCMSFLENNDG